jgi:hypothetical protein
VNSVFGFDGFVVVAVDVAVDAAGVLDVGSL